MNGFRFQSLWDLFPSCTSVLSSARQSLVPNSKEYGHSISLAGRARLRCRTDPGRLTPPRPRTPQAPTWRWMKTTEPSSLQVPPWRSTCSIRRIWRKRMPLRRRWLVSPPGAPPAPPGTSISQRVSPPQAQGPQSPDHLLGRPRVTHLQMSRLRSPGGHSLSPGNE